ncbi:2-keto-4-pentenoate hydratase [Parapedomonas caeni]
MSASTSDTTLLTDDELQSLAVELDGARKAATAIPQVSTHTTLTLPQAYDVQRRSVAHRIAAEQDRQVGVKMGFTSHAKMQQMGLSEVIWGRLTAGMAVAADGTINLAGYVHPRVEAEIAFILKAPLAGVVTAAQAMACVEAVAPALEIIDSRYRNFKFSLSDVIADNASSSGFVMGALHAPDVDIADLAMTLSINGTVAATASSADILGHPVQSLMEASRLVGAAGETLPAGAIILAGGATAAVPLTAGASVVLEVATLGRTGFRVL